MHGFVDERGDSVPAATVSEAMAVEVEVPLRLAVRVADATAHDVTVDHVPKFVKASQGLQAREFQIAVGGDVFHRWP